MTQHSTERETSASGCTHSMHDYWLVRPKGIWYFSNQEKVFMETSVAKPVKHGNFCLTGFLGIVTETFGIRPNCLPVSSVKSLKWPHSSNSHCRKSPASFILVLIHRPDFRQRDAAPFMTALRLDYPGEWPLNSCALLYVCDKASKTSTAVHSQSPWGDKGPNQFVVRCHLCRTGTAAASPGRCLSLPSAMLDSCAPYNGRHTHWQSVSLYTVWQTDRVKVVMSHSTQNTSF